MAPTAIPQALLRLLGQHYGDRSIYLHRSEDRALLGEAVRLGLVSADGELTTEGYVLWRRHGAVS